MKLAASDEAALAQRRSKGGAQHDVCVSVEIEREGSRWPAFGTSQLFFFGVFARVLSGDRKTRVTQSRQHLHDQVTRNITSPFMFECRATKSIHVTGLKRCGRTLGSSVTRLMAKSAQLEASGSAVIWIVVQPSSCNETIE